MILNNSYSKKTISLNPISQKHMLRGVLSDFCPLRYRIVPDLHSFTNVLRVCDFKGYYELKVLNNTKTEMSFYKRYYNTNAVRGFLRFEYIFKNDAFYS